MSLTAGDIAFASLIEHFQSPLSEIGEVDYIKALNAYPKQAVERATDDILGKSDHKRNAYYVGKFPSIDEFLPRVRYHQNRAEEIDKYSNQPRISYKRHTDGIDVKAKLLAKEQTKFEGRPIIAEGLYLLGWKNGIGKWPVGATWAPMSGNVYGPIQ